MNSIPEQSIKRIIGAYGEEFLRYVFALPEEKPVTESIQSTSPEVVLLLQAPLDQATFGQEGELDVMFSARHFTFFRDDLGCTLANYLRQISGGDLTKPKSSEDPVVRGIQDIAWDIWPGLLLRPPARGPRTFWASASLGASSHPGVLEASRAFMADSKLALLFPGSPSLEDAQDTSDLYVIGADWITSGGQVGTRQLVTIFDSIIFSAAIQAQMSGSRLTCSAVFAAIPAVVDAFRKLATRKPVEVSTVIGFNGIQLEAGMNIKFGDDVLREALPIERTLLLNGGERVTSVLETKTAIQLLEIVPRGADDSPDAFFEKISKYSARMQEPYLTLQRRIDRVRLSILLASSGSEYLATSEVSRYVADPTQHGGGASWQMDERSPASYPLTKEQASDVSRLHKLVSEKHPESLDIAMKRILSAVSQRWDATDAFIDAVIVWENAFGTTTETTFRVTGAIAKLLESSNLEARFTLQKELKRLYETRSRLVHGAKEPKPEESWAQRERAISIAIDVLRELYTNRPDLLSMPSDARGASLLLEG